jgi:hypothetical protein
MLEIWPPEKLRLGTEPRYALSNGGRSRRATLMVGWTRRYGQRTQLDRYLEEKKPSLTANCLKGLAFSTI